MFNETLNVKKDIISVCNFLKKIYELKQYGKENLLIVVVFGGDSVVVFVSFTLFIIIECQNEHICKLEAHYVLSVVYTDFKRKPILYDFDF